MTLLSIIPLIHSFIPKPAWCLIPAVAKRRIVALFAFTLLKSPLKAISYVSVYLPCITLTAINAPRQFSCG